MTPYSLAPHDPHLAHTLTLIQAAFAPMEGRIDPPSSIHRLTLGRLCDHAARGEVWAIGAPPIATVIGARHPDALYIGKLAVAPAHRGKGLARVLVDTLGRHAQSLGLTKLRLQARVELIENHLTFAALGFVKTAETSHPGYARATSWTMEKPLI